MIRLLAVAAAMALLYPAVSQAQTKDETNKPAAAAPAKPEGEAKPAAPARPAATAPAKPAGEARAAKPATRGTRHRGTAHRATTHHGATHRATTRHGATHHATTHHRTTHRTVTGHRTTTRETASSRPLPPRNHQFYHRGQYFNQVHASRFVWPHGWRYRQWRIGARFPVIFLNPTYFYTDYAVIGLQAPASGYAWVRFGPDLILVNVTTHEVEDVILGVFIV